MHDNATIAEARIERFVRERIRPAVYRRVSPLTVSAWTVDGEPVPFAEAVGQFYEPFPAGGDWGKPWGTTWFHITGEVPAGWSGATTTPEIVVDLGFSDSQPGFQAEGTAYTSDGVILKAVEPRSGYIPVAAGSPVDVYLEAAANPDVAGDFSFEPTALGDTATAGDGPLYRMRRLELGELDLPVWELLQDTWTLTGLLAELPVDQPRRAQIVRALDQMVHTMDPDAVGATAAAGREALAAVLASPASASAHRLAAVGHAHIDSAWLWPTRETVRKVARTFSNVLALMDRDPDFTFAASSAQQYAWVKEFYPELFERVRAQVAAGRFVPVGGMWVESDTNMPGGEAMARQFVAGKAFFQREFGIEPLEVWLPDSFGYTAALPQIMVAAGSRWLLTQKMSWNETNRMPHHTFWWEGVDGTRVFTHFPPVDTYASEISGSELARAERQFSEKGAANTSLLPFGWGDGGGGPTREMLAAIVRTGDLEGSPRTTLTTPGRFFAEAEAEYPQAPVWSGELYLEFHRGTYTSQAKTKRGNRQSEHLLREAELWAATATVQRGTEYPYDELESLWKTVLLQQFHDILPGTSIAWVHQEAERNYAAVAERLEAIIATSIGVLAGDGSEPVVFNAGPRALDGVAALGWGTVAAASPTVAESSVDGFVLRDDRVSVLVDHRGLVVSLLDRDADRETIPVGEAGNLLQLFRDTPVQWDAWDIDETYRTVGTDLTDVTDVAITDDGRGIRVDRRFGSSTVTQELRLNGSGSLNITTIVDWHERQKLLKLAFPLDVLADRATSEIQFGHVHRSTHANTSWDAARFETVAHRWVHVGEPGYGVAIANDATYGHDIHRMGSPSGPFTLVRLSLLRAPLFPDPTADQGRQEFTVSVRVGSGIPDAVSEGYRLNLPLRSTTGSGSAPLLAVDEPAIVAIDEPSIVAIDEPAIVVEAVKLAEDRSGDLIVRLYEAHGTRATGVLTAAFAWSSAIQTDLLERPIEQTAITDAGADRVGLTLRPFQLVTLRISRA